MDPSASSPPSLLAADADAAVRRLTRRTGGGELGSPAELYRVLGALRLLAGDLARLLPALQSPLEDGLLAGRITAPGAADPIAAAWDSAGEAGHALTHAGTVALLLTRELEKAQVALRDLAAP